MEKKTRLVFMLEEIEKARKQMILLANDNSLNSKEVIDASTKLDKLLNVYHHHYVIKKKRKEPAFK